MKQGYIVRRIRGWTPMRVLRAMKGTVETIYCGQQDEYSAVYRWDELTTVTDAEKEFSKCPDWRSRLTPNDQAQLLRQARKEPNQQTQTKETTMTKLFQTKEETPRFGTLLATNSAGLYVLEMKGSGDVLTFAKTDVEEVKPYTVGIQFLDGSGREYHYLSRKGELEVGDLILVKGSDTMARVKRVNTASDKATKELVGHKVMSVAIGTESADVIDDSDDGL